MSKITITSKLLNKTVLALLLVVLLSFLIQAQENAPKPDFRFILPGANWGVDLQIPGLQVEMEELGKTEYLAHASSMFLKKQTINAVLMVHLQSQKTGSQKLPPSQPYALPSGRTIPGLIKTKQSDNALVASLIKDNVLITIRLSFASDPKKSDEKYFYDLLESLRFVDTTTPTRSYDFYFRGRPYYLVNDYPKAIEYFSQAFDLEKQKSELTKPQIRKFVMELADSLGALRRVADYKTVLEFGVEKDPTYYQFHWGLASYYAAQGNRLQTLAELQLAYDTYETPIRKMAGMVGQPTPPDPFNLAVFTRFSKDEEFRKAVKKMQKDWQNKQ